ncbi:MAG: hypothetical protein MJY80_01805 [Bacteroidales bacterium]|nr:hypothetical protein [Bacteroidales bacterium]
MSFNRAEKASRLAFFNTQMVLRKFNVLAYLIVQAFCAGQCQYRYAYNTD